MQIAMRHVLTVDNLEGVKNSQTIIRILLDKGYNSHAITRFFAGMGIATVGPIPNNSTRTNAFIFPDKAGNECKPNTAKGQRFLPKLGAAAELTSRRKVADGHYQTAVGSRHFNRIVGLYAPESVARHGEYTAKTGRKVPIVLVPMPPLHAGLSGEVLAAFAALCPDATQLTFAQGDCQAWVHLRKFTITASVASQTMHPWASNGVSCYPGWAKLDSRARAVFEGRNKLFFEVMTPRPVSKWRKKTHLI